MIEVHPAILHHVVQSKAHGSSGIAGVVLVDDADSTLSHSGEIVQSGLTAHQILEIGKALDFQHDSKLTRSDKTWLAEGLVVYKSVGVGMTDLVAGNAILALAEKGISELVSQDFEVNGGRGLDLYELECMLEIIWALNVFKFLAIKNDLQRFPIFHWHQ